MQWIGSVTVIAMMAFSIAACAPSRNDGWGDLAKGVGYVLGDED